jgi:hypothetical protein
MQTLSYPYKGKPWLFLLMSLAFGVCAYLTAFAALTNDRGLVFNGIHFSPRGATIFYGCLAFLCTLFVALLLPAFILGLVRRARVTLTDTALSAPKSGLRGKLVVVPLEDIDSLTLQAIQGTKFLHVHHRNGQVTIHQGLLPSAAAFEELCAAIRDRTPALGATRP